MYRGHDLTVRFKWKNANDIGEFPNRLEHDHRPSTPPPTLANSTEKPFGIIEASFTATFDYDLEGVSASATAPWDWASVHTLIHQASRGVRRSDSLTGQHWRRVASEEAKDGGAVQQ